MDSNTTLLLALIATINAIALALIGAWVKRSENRNHQQHDTKKHKPSPRPSRKTSR